MVVLSVYSSTLNDATQPTATSVGDNAGHTFANTGREILYVSAGTTSIDTTIVTTQSVTTGTVALELADLDLDVPANEFRVIGPFPVAQFGSIVTISGPVVDTDRFLVIQV